MQTLLSLATTNIMRKQIYQILPFKWLGGGDVSRMGWATPFYKLLEPIAANLHASHPNQLEINGNGRRNSVCILSEEGL